MTGSGSGGLDDTVPLMEEDPNDGQVTRKVKRAYGAIDGFRYVCSMLLQINLMLIFVAFVLGTF